MTFDQIKEQLEKHSVVWRESWNTDTFLIKQVPAVIPGENLKNLQSFSQVAKDFIGEVKEIRYDNQYLLVTVTNKIVFCTYWFPTIQDFLADDWEALSLN